MKTKTENAAMITKITEKLIACGNNPDWSKQAVENNLEYINKTYGKCTVREAAEIIRTIA